MLISIHLTEEIQLVKGQVQVQSQVVNLREYPYNSFAIFSPI